MKDMDPQEFLSKARERFEAWESADHLDREAAQDDNRFAYADDKDLGQWDENAKKARANRPVLQWNRIPTYTHQVINAGRQSKPAVKVSPLEQTPPETAEYIQGRIRHIEYESNADTAKDWSIQQQIVSGRGFYRVKLEWIPGTQKQRICIEAIPNQFSVAWDPSAVKYTCEDSDWWFVFSLVSKQEYIRDYGQEAYDSRIAFTGRDDPAPEWIGLGSEGELIQVAEYIVAEWTKRTVPADGDQPERTENVRSWKSYVIDGAQVLTPGAELLGSTCQIVPVWGEQAVVDSVLRNYSLIRNAKTPQRNANLFLSNLSEQIGQMPKAPYLVAKGGVAAEDETDWDHANSTPLSVLYWKAYDATGRPLPKPERIIQEPPIQALLEGMNSSFEAMKASMGIFDPSVGATQESKQSGVAVQKLQNQAGLGNFHFPDNAARSNKYLGEILVELIKVIDRPGSENPVRAVNGKTHSVPVGVPHIDYKTKQLVVHDLLSAQVGVTVSTGPSYETARQEAYDRDSAIVQAVPELMFVIGDQLFENDDTAGAEERAERMRRYIAMKNPGLIQDNGQGQNIPPQVQQQLNAQQAELQKAHAFAQSLHEQLQTKQPEIQANLQKAQMDDATKRWTVQQQEETKRVIGLATINAQAAMDKLEKELGILKDKMDRFHDLNMQAADQKHAKETAQAAQQAAAQGQASQQQAAADSQENAQQFQADQAAQTADQEPEGE